MFGKADPPPKSGVIKSIEARGAMLSVPRAQVSGLFFEFKRAV